MSENEERGKEFFRIVKTAFENLGMDSLLNFLPFLRYIIPGGLGYWTHEKNIKALYSHLRKEVQEHINTLKEGDCRDFTDYYLAEIKKRKALGKDQPPFVGVFKSSSNAHFIERERVTSFCFSLMLHFSRSLGGHII